MTDLQNVDIDFFQLLQSMSNDDPIQSQFQQIFDSTQSVFGIPDSLSVTNIFDELNGLTTPLSTFGAPLFPEVQPQQQQPQQQHTPHNTLKQQQQIHSTLQQHQQPQQNIKPTTTTTTTTTNTNPFTLQFSATANPNSVFQFSKPIPQNTVINNKVSHVQGQSPTYMQPNFVSMPHSPMERSSDLLSLAEGFTTTLAEKVDSGRGNRIPLPRQVIEINVAHLLKGTGVALENLGRSLPLKVALSLIKFDKVHNKKAELTGKIAEQQVVAEDVHPHRVGDVVVTKRFVAKFDNVIIQETSHNNGGKLFLRFTLSDNNNNFLAYLDSAEFQTITNRGRKKRDERDDRSKTQGNDPCVDAVNPNMGPACGGQLVKVCGQGFTPSPCNSRVMVKFGDKLAREVYSVKRNIIVCETPDGEGKVDVSVSFDGGLTALESCATYKYINPNNTDDVTSFISQMIRPNVQNPFISGGGGGSPFSGVGTPFSGFSGYSSGSFNSFSNSLAGFSAWLMQGTGHPCGFTPLHCCASFGFSDFAEFLINELDNRDLNVYINRRDNFGRTPLHWAIIEGQWSFADFLVSQGADLGVSDDLGNNIIHLAVQSNGAEIVKLVQNILGEDSEEMEDTKTLADLFGQSNQDGYTPSTLAMQGGDLFADLEQLKIHCDQLLYHNTILLSEVVLRSGGSFASQSMLTEQGKSFMTLHLSTTAEEGQETGSENKGLAVTFYKKADDGKWEITRAHISSSRIAFLILEQTEKRAEFTLDKAPSMCQYDTTSRSWKPLETTDYLGSCLSFFAYMSGDSLAMLHSHLQEKMDAQLSTFRPFCFVRRTHPLGSETGNTSPTQKFATANTNRLQQAPAQTNITRV